MFANLHSLLGSGIKSLGLRLASWDVDRERKEGERLFEQSDYAGAQLHLAQAVLESERRQESADRRILLRLELAEAQRRQYEAVGDPQKLEEAEKTVRSAFDLASRSGDRELLAQTLDALVTIAADLGNLNEVERLMQELSALEAKRKRRDPMQLAHRLHRLGLLRLQHGQMREAVGSLAESAAIHEQILGGSHPLTAHQLSNLGAAQHALGNHAEAQRCLRRSIRIHEEHAGLDSPKAVADLQVLTASLEAAGDIDGAAAEFERVLAMKLRLMGQDLDATAEAQFLLAQRYMHWRRYSRARELLMEAVGTFKRTGGARLANGYEGLAQLEEDTGRYEEAIRELERAGRVWESVKSDHVEELIRNLEHRVFLFDLLCQHNEAAFLREQMAALAEAARWAEVG
jgi:tetratricopeptide (TPR) repeat protein